MKTLLRIAASLVVAGLLLAAPVVAGDGPLYKVTTPRSCYDGDGQFLSNPAAYGSYATIKAWLRKQQRGGPKDVKDGICEHWTNEWTIYVPDPGSPPEGPIIWNWYRASYGCR